MNQMHKQSMYAKDYIIRCATLGCRLNQSETELIKEQLRAAGFTVSDHENPNVYIVNTCTVTQRGERSSRKMVYRIMQKYPEADIIVTGCYAHTNPEVFTQIPAVKLIINNFEKDVLYEKIANYYHITIPPVHTVRMTSVAHRSRPFIKIQDGCNNECSFCKVRSARGYSRSINSKEILEQAGVLYKKGYPEIGLTGVNIGDYYDGKLPLAGLLALLINMLPKAQFRLSSIEPKSITTDLIKILSHTSICKHLHIPLQSGSDSILAAMNRKYTTKEYRKIVEDIRTSIPDISIGADLIVGFPGETEDIFSETYDFVKALNIQHIHVFSYSSRPGFSTVIEKNNVPENSKKKRSSLLYSMVQKSNYIFRRQFEGRILSVVIENKKCRIAENMRGMSSYYFPVTISSYKPELLGKKIKVHITEVTPASTYGTLV